VLDSLVAKVSKVSCNEKKHAESGVYNTLKSKAPCHFGMRTCQQAKGVHIM